ncbi:MAG: TIGR03643 family protein [Pseudomonadota bacterium]
MILEPDVSELIELAWADDVTFDAIREQTGCSEQAVIAIMRRHLKPSSFRLWRRRVSGRQSKHAARST